ncbi:MAG: PDZ domain-containing protein [Candidatus Zixiibacteriota bacterium]
MRRCFYLIYFTLITTMLFASNPDDPFVGIGHSTSDEPPGIKIDRIVDGAPADIAGLESGDVIIKMNDFKPEKQEDLTTFIEDKSAGDLIELKVKRCQKELNVNLILGKRSDFQGEMRKGGRENFPKSADEIFAGWKDDSTIGLVFEAIDKAGQKENYDSLAAAFQNELELYKGYYTLDAVALGILQPAATFSSGEWIINMLDIQNARPDRFIEAAGLIIDARYGDIDFAERKLEDIPPDFQYDGLTMVQEAVVNANDDIAKAFEKLSKEELDIIEDATPFLLETFSKTVYITSEDDEELVEWYEDLLAATKKIDYDPLVNSGSHLAALYDSDFLKSLEQIKYDEDSTYKNDIIIDTMVKVGEKLDSLGQPVDIMGRMIVSGKGSGIYSQEAAIWIDLGGDDTYFGFSGGTPYTIYDNIHHNHPYGRVGLHIDLGGNDRYIRNTIGSIGSGYAGAGCLIDVSGDDFYSGDRLTMGAAFCGCGILIDEMGNDTYLAQECGQGFAAFGCGILYDASGDDLHHGARYVQGVGITKAVGMLVNIEGDDRYVASHKIPNGYGNENTWDGWSQGVGMGFRSFAAGGIGILADGNGNDHYEAGNFSQACGYFFGFGILDDMKGDDVYIANRYVQGAGAHQAMAYFHDRNGNDSYYGNEAMNQGGAWDIQSVYFIDDNGDDKYEGSSYAQGGTAQTAFAVFLDKDGIDSYKSGNISNGKGGALTYHPDYNAKNVTLSIDLGNDKDDYSNTHDERQNNTFMKLDNEDEKGDGIFWDK